VKKSEKKKKNPKIKMRYMRSFFQDLELKRKERKEK